MPERTAPLSPLTTSHYRTPDELKATSAAACAQNAGGSPARPGKKIFAGPRKRARKRAARRWLLGTARCSRVWLGASTHCPKGRCKRSIQKTRLMSALARELLSCPVATAQRHAQPSGSGCLGGGSPKLDSTTIPLNGLLLQCAKSRLAGFGSARACARSRQCCPQSPDRWNCRDVVSWPAVSQAINPPCRCFRPP